MGRTVPLWTVPLPVQGWVEVGLREEAERLTLLLGFLVEDSVPRDGVSGLASL